MVAPVADFRSGHDAKKFVAWSRSTIAQIDSLLNATDHYGEAARAAFKTATEAAVLQKLFEMPLASLKETTRGGVRLGPIEAAGIRTVGQAAAAGLGRLQSIPGVGPHTASQVVAAASQIHSALVRSTRFRFDPDVRPANQEELLSALWHYREADRLVKPIRDDLVVVRGRAQRLVPGAQRASSKLRLFFSGPARRRQARSELDELVQVWAEFEAAGSQDELDQAVHELASFGTVASARLWLDYLQNPVEFNTSLAELAGVTSDIVVQQGRLPLEIADAVQAFELDTTFLTVGLRGYQAFGAKYALVQRNVIIGDEMGLGKTIEALAVMCHLEAEGQMHFLVVCPASVVVNWMKEIERKSQLTPHRLHGTERDFTHSQWLADGGIAVTTYETLRRFEIPDDVKLGLLVVDEAHYVKNPEARRTQAVRRWIQVADRTVFLTGTPLENRVEEFKTLVNHLQPEIAAKIHAVDALAAADTFRSTVAPVYLRRNQDEVLDELPPRIESQAWVEFGKADLGAYRDAVASGNFMAMRRAAYEPGSATGSSKLARLLEIVEESRANGHKVVVFSFFRDVLTTVVDALPGVAIGPINGDVPPTQRQELVDEFTDRHDSAVLVSQIEAGGVGLNMQAGSVVILAEPQWKPTTENQAIARCHRMGQVRPVEVYRILAVDSVDQRMLEVLSRKSQLFDEFARKSDMTDASPHAKDISHLDVVKEVANRAEADIIRSERERLGIEVNA